MRPFLSPSVSLRMTATKCPGTLRAWCSAIPCRLRGLAHRRKTYSTQTRCRPLDKRLRCSKPGVNYQYGDYSKNKSILEKGCFAHLLTIACRSLNAPGSAVQCFADAVTRLACGRPQSLGRLFDCQRRSGGYKVLREYALGLQFSPDISSPVPRRPSVTPWHLCRRPFQRHTRLLGSLRSRLRRSQ